jgi:hypothetical protein
MTPENEQVKREKRHKPYNKYNNGYQQTQHSPREGEESTFINYQNKYEKRPFNKPEYSGSFQKPYYNGPNPVPGYIHYQQTEFKGILLNVNGAQLKVHHNEDLNDPKTFDRLAKFVDQLTIAKEFERDALLLKLVRELEARGIQQLDKSRYNELVDKFIRDATSHT